MGSAEDLDEDGDGFTAAADPDDLDGTVYPSAPEIDCDGIDQDLDGEDACPVDGDEDGFRADVDCDDSDPSVSPSEIEVYCNGLDENCDGHDNCDSDGDGNLDWFDPDPADPAVFLHRPPADPPSEGP